MAQVLCLEERPAKSRRSALEVRMSILRATSEGAKKPTRLMYQSNTSWVILQKNLLSLVSLGLVRESGNGQRSEYAITDTGLAVVREYDRLVERAAPTLEAVPR